MVIRIELRVSDKGVMSASFGQKKLNTYTLNTIVSQTAPLATLQPSTWVHIYSNIFMKYSFLGNNAENYKNGMLSL